MKMPATRLVPMLVVVIVTTDLYAAFVLALVHARGDDISRFVLAGYLVDPKKVPPGLAISPNVAGYDGVAFYRLALDPFTREQNAFGITLDAPSYRQQRIGYPLLAWALSAGGRPALAPLMLVVVNFAALVALGITGAALANSFGLSPLWGIVFPLYPGFLTSLSRDTSEIVMAAFALAAILAILFERFVAAGLLLTYAVLTRETALMIVAGLAAMYGYDLVRRRAKRVSPIVFLLPAAVYLCWQITLGALWGVFPLNVRGPAFTRPFVEYAAVLSATWRHAPLQRAECIYLTVMVLTAGVALSRSAASVGLRLAWLGHLALGSILPHEVWADHYGFMRILSDLFLLSAVVIIPAGRPGRWILMLTTVLIWPYVAHHIVAVN